jgi:signal transduction histidine kinase
MLRRPAPWYAVAAVVSTVVGIGAEWVSTAAWRWSDVAVGVALALSGAAVVAARRLESGVALMATSAAWFVGTVVPSRAFTVDLHRPMLVTALLLFALPAAATSRTRLVSWAFVVVVWLAWFVAQPRAVGPAVGVTVVSIGLVNSLVVRRRRHVVHAAPWIPLLGWTFVAVPLATYPDPLWYEAAVAATGVLCAAVASARRPRPDLLLAVDLGLVAPGRTGDVSLHLLGSADEVSSSGGCSVLELGDGRRLAVEHPPDTVLTPPLIADLRRTGLLMAEHLELGEALQRRAVEVAESRERLAIATARERERFENDLRFNVVPHLDRLRSVLAFEPGSALQVVDDLRREVDALCAGGVPIEFEADLSASLHALARDSPIPVHLQVLPVSCAPQVARAIWFIVAESLANATRHAGATRVDVVLRQEHGRIELTVVDDGVGGADPSRGTGVRGLEDRARAAGGALSIESPTGGGTTVRFSAPW